MAQKPWDELKVDTVMVDPSTLKPRKLNARYMEPAEFERLVENIKTDGCLTSSPLCCELKNGDYEILSGHHRTKAAIEAGFKKIEILLIKSPLSEDRKKAIQLSHNAINGKDDISKLKKLYENLDLGAKKFSGLDDSILGDLDGLGLPSLGAAGIKHQEMNIYFLPNDAELFQDIIDKISKRQRPLTSHFVHIDDFNKIFDAIVDVKHKTNIHNSSTALLKMAELALMKLEEMEEANAREQK